MQLPSLMYIETLHVLDIRLKFDENSFQRLESWRGNMCGVGQRGVTVVDGR